MPFPNVPLYKPAFRVGTATTAISGSAIGSCIGLYNSHSDTVTVTIKDGQGKVISVQSISAGDIVWADYANITKGKGFFFQDGISISASLADKVDAWIIGYEQSNSVRPFLAEVLPSSFVLPGVQFRVTSVDTMLVGMALYNSHSSAVTVTIADANGRVLSVQTIDPNATAWLDLASKTDGQGFLFAGGLRLTASVASKITAWVAAFTQN